MHPIDNVDKGCVLLTDDEDALRRAFARKLRSVGHEIVEASSGNHALELLTQLDIDVVVSDIRMPDVDGVELLRRAHAIRPDIPVILMTGAPDLESAVKAVEYGAFEYLTKPVELAKLTASVGRAVQQHHTTTERRRLVDSATRQKKQSAARVAAELGTGSVLADKYRIGTLLGFGGMGTVYEAVREDLARMSVAVKVLHPRHIDRTDLIARCRREAEVVAAINHPNIVKVLDFVSEWDGPPFLVMERLHGTTLGAAIERQQFSQERVAFIAAQVLNALGAAHASNVIHRDLKPDNVFLTTISGLDDVVKLLDFGIAKPLDPLSGKLTETGIVLGTPGYIAPEYARGENVDTRADIYGVGCIMYEALARHAPFSGDNYNAILFAIQHKDPEPLRSHRPDVSPELAAIVARAMARDPADRFQTASAMEAALAPWLARSSGARKASAPSLAAAPTVPVRRGE